MKKIIIIILLVIAVCQPAFGAENIGEIEIPCLKIKMPFFSAEQATMQDVIDEEQSALFYQWQQASRIVDHAFSEDENGNQWNIQKIFPGAYAIITINDKRYFYECYLSGKTNYINDQEYFNNRLIVPDSSYDILLACCAENSNHHFIAVFKRLSEF